MLLCPECNDVIKDTACKSGKHRFETKAGVLDLMPQLTDNRLIEEAQYTDKVAETGKMVINADKYIQSEMFKKRQKIFVDHIISNFHGNSLTIGEIGCGEGSAILYLHDIPFRVDYYGVDISLKIMQAGLKRTHIPNTWKVNFFRATADKQLFANNSLDVLFSASALHHLELRASIAWIARTLKHMGLLIIYEPSQNNIFARIGRKLVPAINTGEEHPLDHREVQSLARENGLRLLHEQGLYYLSGALGFMISMMRSPLWLSKAIYPMSRRVDNMVKSPDKTYAFLQIYRKN
jgi:ubiquinone/menaquinone biosynthesis C-methylase UbiE